MLKASNIHKSYGGLDVLKGVDIEVKKGEIVSIVGASGAGKSTLLHILGTLDSADEGEVVIDGVHIESRPRVEFNRASIWQRLCGWLVDNTFIAIVFIITSLFLQPYFLEELMSFSYWVDYVSLVTIYFIYYLMGELLEGQTIGKLICGTRAINLDDGTRPSFVQVFLRAVVRLFPLDWLSFFSKKPSGWHDTVSNTAVVESDFRFKKKVERSLTDKRLSEFRNRHIGFIFQFHNLLPEFTAVENVCIPAYIGKFNKEEVESRAYELLDILGVGHRLHHKPAEMSGGEQQRVAIARALINNPVIVFADEPSGNLDSHNAEELHKLFFKLRDELGQTFVIVTHNQQLADISDRKIEMKDGKIFGEGAVKEDHSDKTT